MISLPLHEVQLQLRANSAGQPTVFDPVRKRWFVLTPEEHVRQLLLSYLLHTMRYPASLIAVERTLNAGEIARRFDVVVYGRDHKPWLLIECKAPEVPITEASFHQLLSYQRHLGARYWILCNGIDTLCADATDPVAPHWLADLPAYEL